MTSEIRKTYRSRARDRNAENVDGIKQSPAERTDFGLTRFYFLNSLLLYKINGKNHRVPQEEDAKEDKDSELRIKGEEYIKETRPFRPIEREIQHEVVV